MSKKRYENLIVNNIHWAKNLPDHEGSAGEQGYPIIMNGELVPGANAWVAPCLQRATAEVSKVVSEGKFGKATPHIHDGDEMYLILGEEGASTLEIMLGDKFYEVTTPAAVYIPKGLPHSIEMTKFEEGKFGGACVLYLDSEYITKPVPENFTKIDIDTDKLVVNNIHWAKNLPDHEGSAGEQGYPIIMNGELVPGANAWVAPCLQRATEEVSKLVSEGKFGKATPHIHDGDEMYLMLGEEGASTLEIMLGDEFYEVTTPAAVYIPKGLPHSIEMTKFEKGKFGGACVVYLDSEYITKPVPR